MRSCARSASWRRPGVTQTLHRPRRPRRSRSRSSSAGQLGEPRRSAAPASATATGSRCSRQNNPEWCLTFWGTVNIGAILVGLNGWWKTDEIVYGLQDSGAKVLVVDAKRFERIADHLDECPDLEPSS